MPTLIWIMVKQTVFTYLQLIKRLIFVVYDEASSGGCPKLSSSPGPLCRKEPSSEGVKGMEACWFLLYTIRNKPKDRFKLNLKPGAIKMRWRALLTLSLRQKNTIELSTLDIPNTVLMHGPKCLSQRASLEFDWHKTRGFLAKYWCKHSKTTFFKHEVVRFIYDKLNIRVNIHKTTNDVIAFISVVLLPDFWTYFAFLSSWGRSRALGQHCDRWLLHVWKSELKAAVKGIPLVL